jgi:Na+/H+ antiporter NhaD/arsenite permease-like protein
LPDHAISLDGTPLGWPWALPFAGILVSIALGPVLFPKLWHDHHGKIAAGWAALTLAPIGLLYGLSAMLAALTHAMLAEYLSFIVLLFALYTVTGGILVTGTVRGTPVANTAILALGTGIASIVGTTGAAMMLIRPLIRANQARRHKTHVVIFFIILVANVGGALTPLGDPPLFVGFLRGVDFFWPAQNLWMQTVTVAVLLLIVFFLVDTWRQRSEAPIPAGEPYRALRIRGGINFLLIALIVAVTILSVQWRISLTVFGTALELQSLVRDGALVLIALLSLRLTGEEHRAANEFTWGPIKEVAKLFAGIFCAVIPVLAMLAQGRNGTFAWLIAAISRPDGTPNEAAYFWLTGIGFARQRPDLLGLFRAGWRRSTPVDGAARRHAGCHLHGCGLHGSAHLRRKRAQLHGVCYRYRTGHPHAGFPRLHDVGRSGAGAALPVADGASCGAHPVNGPARRHAASQTKA